MIIRAIATDELNANVALLARIETALFAIDSALEICIKSDDEDQLYAVRVRLAGLIGAIRADIGLS